MTPTSTHNATLTSSTRREVFVVLGVTLLSAVPRFVGFGREGLTHFDEGVYALSGLWSIAPGGLATLDPELIAYAPPGFPVLIGLAYSLLGTSAASALFVSAWCGVLTVPLAAWLAWRTFGAGAGAAAAGFTALSLAHIAFSRKALTDVPFLLAWLAAIGLGGRFLERPRVGRAIAFGLGVGIAQNLKYNGWVAGAVVIVAALAGLAVDGDSRRPSALARTFGLGLVAALVAGLIYLPWYLFVETHGGYAALVRHHRSYLGGAASWLPHWRQQLAQVVALSGGITGGAAAWAGAWIAAGVGVHGWRAFFPRSGWDGARFRVGLLFGAAALATIPDLAWWVGLAWSGWLLADRRPTWRVLGAWWIVFSAMTPFYHPYARLWLPLHAAGWIMLAGGVVTFGPFPGSAFEVADFSILTRKKVLIQGAVTLVCLFLAQAHWGQTAPRAFAISDVFEPTDGFRVLASELVTTSPFAAHPEESLHVLGRRALAFELAIQGRARFRLLAAEDWLTSVPMGAREWALVDGAQIGGGTTDGARWKPIDRLWRRVETWDVALDPVTRLDVNPESPYEHYPADPVAAVLFLPRSQPIPKRTLPGPRP